MSGHPRRALWLLLPTNTIALGLGLAVAQGVVALPSSPPALHAAAPTSVPSDALPLTMGVTEPERRPRPAAVRPAPVPRVAAPVPPRVPARSAAAPRHAVNRSARVRVPLRSFEQEMRRQVARIPLYQPGVARWVVVPDLAVYGVTSLRTRTIYLSPRIPRKLLYSVVAHEWGHVISTQAYGGDLHASQQAFKEWFGGGSMKVATERAADCIAVLLGASWTHYTGCRDEHWRLGALYLANGMKLPRES